MSLPQQLSLYNGVSDRSRGWKSKKSDKPTNGHMISNSSVMRWDGAAKSNSTWDGLRRDPELWYRDGDCYVHLYGYGQSQRGPAFKIPFSALLEANCYPLVDRFMLNDVAESSPMSALDHDYNEYSRLSNRHHRIELYIPAPPRSNKQQLFTYHLATRNFFAFICRRSLVGEHLGSALITLMHSMHEFRTADVDNLADLVGYMDEEGYLEIKNQPSHALAVLHLAETFQLRDLYIDAFAHCCGMSDQLFLGPEYQLLSSVTRKLLLRGRVEMDLKLGQMGSMLKTFLQDELSEAHLGLYPGARAHLERFRTLLQGVYAAKFGYYPPPSIDPRTTVFEIDVLHTLRTDFEALFQYLVDEAFDTSQNSPHSAQGGICTLQSVQSFDERYTFSILNHPLPLLPEVPQQTISRRMSWFNKQAKGDAGQRAAVHAALLRATNQDKIELLDNGLVKAYRKFEEDSVYCPMKADKQENLSLVDARKVRWILIYSIYQTLRQATEPPPEVKDALEAPYNLCVSTVNLPPWKDEITLHSLIRQQTGQITRSASVSSAGWSGSTECETRCTSLSFELKPDIDYLALSSSQDAMDLTGPTGYPKNPDRVTSLTSSLSRNGTVRRSLSLFNRNRTEKSVSQLPRKPAQYHEIMVQGYGNGTNDVEVTVQGQRDSGAALPVKFEECTTTTARSPSTSSNSSKSSDNSSSEGGSAFTSDTSADVVGDSNQNTNNFSWNRRRSSAHGRGRMCDLGFDGPPRRAMSMCIAPKLPSHLILEKEQVLAPLVKPQRSHPRLGDHRKQMEPPPLQIRKAYTVKTHADTDDVLEMPISASSTAWDDINELVEVRGTGFGPEDNVKFVWDDYNDLGGLTELKNVPPRPKRASTVF
ncbi:hypothetical protein BJ170DRAFT_354801 [Xylariales sp. AK1849]|nr:hypothetical protein BJ170DRAFT_354801 [Xylariales sp. AK1849]